MDITVVVVMAIATVASVAVAMGITMVVVIAVATVAAKAVATVATVTAEAVATVAAVAVATVATVATEAIATVATVSSESEAVAEASVAVAMGITMVVVMAISTVATVASVAVAMGITMVVVMAIAVTMTVAVLIVVVVHWLWRVVSLVDVDWLSDSFVDGSVNIDWLGDSLVYGDLLGYNLGWELVILVVNLLGWLHDIVVDHTATWNLHDVSTGWNHWGSLHWGSHHWSGVHVHWGTIFNMATVHAVTIHVSVATVHAVTIHVSVTTVHAMTVHAVTVHVSVAAIHATVHVDIVVDWCHVDWLRLWLRLRVVVVLWGVDKNKIRRVLLRHGVITTGLLGRRFSFALDLNSGGDSDNAGEDSRLVHCLE